MACQGQPTVKVRVEAVLEQGAGAKVDKLEPEGLEVDEEVLVLDVPVEDPLPVAGNHRLNHLHIEGFSLLFYYFKISKTRVRTESELQRVLSAHKLIFI